jgi:hypothetical protein
VTSDERLAKYMTGWEAGVASIESLVMDDRIAWLGFDVKRGYVAGRAACAAARQVERERLLGIEPCPRCLGTQVVLDNWNTAAECPDCHATGERMP